eukprot:TRINITY_DN2388_c0_g1_i1.p1 TRINITY_DN2388_c0_g1~~TRINITY_DN2388_c0_g1_i1.p1  ORF type:complete len:590 (-),score=80.07 TRINITY_DN2388_c0_g1_i1:543-2312(-)
MRMKKWKLILFQLIFLYFIGTTADLVNLSNDFVSLEFSEETGSLTSLTNLLTNTSYLDPNPLKSTLWQLYYTDEKGATFNIDNTFPSSLSFDLLSLPNDSLLLQLRWENLHVGPHENGTYVVVNITIPGNNATSPSAISWRIGVYTLITNITIWQVNFPLISNFYNITGNFYQSVLYGQISSAQSSFSAYWPDAAAAMQFLAYLPNQDEGLYVATHDGIGYVKQFIYNYDTYSGIEVEHPIYAQLLVQQYPENMGTTGLSYESPYDVVIQPFLGQWWDATQIYRNWVLKNAIWCQKGNLRNRTDIPSWLEKVGVWVNPGNGNYQQGDPFVLLPQLMNFYEYFKMPVAVHWYQYNPEPFNCNYPQYLPPKEGFGEVIEYLHANYPDVKLVPYTNARIFDQNSELWDSLNASSWATKSAAARMNPQTLQYNIEVYSGQETSVMCPATDFWPATMGSIVQEFYDTYHVDGIYLDQIAARPADLCFDPSHGHPLGGGHHWVDGTRNLISQCSQEGKLVTVEENEEHVIDLVGGLLMWCAPGSFPGAYQAVYGGWVNLFGRSFSASDINEISSFASNLGGVTMFCLIIDFSAKY